MSKGGNVPQLASLYVGDLNPDVTEAMLYEVFNSVGPVGSIRVCRDSVTRKSLGYGYVNFHNVKDAERSLDTLNYSSIKGRSCRIMWSQRDPSLRKSGAGNVFVKNLDPNIDNKALYDTFSLFGNILSCKVGSDSNGKSRGYGFVHYETDEAAKQAIERVDGMQIGEKMVQVQTFIKRDEKEKSDTSNFTNIYVKNFPADWDDAKVLEEFGKFGNITSSVVQQDSKGRKAGFINFETNEIAREAIAKMHEADLRTDEQKAEGKEPETGLDGHPAHLVYASRAQSKAERAVEFRDKYVSEGGKGAGSQSGVNLFIKNLDETTDDAALKELFEPFGTVTSSVAMRDDKGSCKGFGFVCFATPDEATKAVTELHLKVVKGKPLYVGLAEKREARQERLRQRYNAGPSKGKGGGKGGGGAKGGGGFQSVGGGGGMHGMGMQPQMMGGMMGLQGVGMPGMMMPQMGAKGMPNMMMPQMSKGMPQMGGSKGMMPGMMMPGGKPGMPGMPLGMMGPMGPMMRPQMPMVQPGQMRPQGQQQGQMMNQNSPMSAAALAAAPPGVQKQMLGEKLFPQIAKYKPEFAGKITGMMLEMDNSELLILLESEQQLKNKVDEAMRVLDHK